ncbi:MAG: hypothetical protein IKV41_04480 [Oscillospiraceae bacterium]|nr:hypothetical protein [Oscillospiraceae bacterium]
MPKCSDCAFFYSDDRIIKYRRQPMFFCNRKGSLHSRNFRIGEGTRIAADCDACSMFKPAPSKAAPAKKIYIDKD